MGWFEAIATNKQSTDNKEGRHLKITNINSRSLPVLPDHLLTKVFSRRVGKCTFASMGWLAEMTVTFPYPSAGMLKAVTIVRILLDSVTWGRLQQWKSICSCTAGGFQPVSGGCKHAASAG